MFAKLCYNKAKKGGAIMDINVIYEYLLSKISEDLSAYGYKRSGKSTLFYRYSADKKVGCAFEMQKSLGKSSFIALLNACEIRLFSARLTVCTLPV